MLTKLRITCRLLPPTASRRAQFSTVLASLLAICGCARACDAFDACSSSSAIRSLSSSFSRSRALRVFRILPVSKSGGMRFSIPQAVRHPCSTEGSTLRAGSRNSMEVSGEPLHQFVTHAVFTICPVVRAVFFTSCVRVEWRSRERLAASVLCELGVERSWALRHVAPERHVAARLLLLDGIVVRV